LELLILEQQESIQILRNLQPSIVSHARGQSSDRNDVVTAISSQKKNNLGSIDEMSSTSDDRFSSSTNVSDESASVSWESADESNLRHSLMYV